jgi:hypothetical protein
MILEYIPRAQVHDSLKDGWRLVPGHEYQPGEYAVLMHRPDAPEELAPLEMEAQAARFMPLPRKRGNRRAGAASRAVAKLKRLAMEPA